jgi:hypothetical protein
MGQGLTRALRTYSKLKDLAIGLVPHLQPKSALISLLDVGFKYFMDNDASIA